MSLVEIWNKTRKQIEGKKVHQIVAIAGDGDLRDNNTTSLEFRDFLSLVPSNILKQFVEQCLLESFTDSGYVLQDLVNQIGRRLGFKVTYGRYHGITGQIGFDGLWEFPDGHIVIVEVKTTDAYQIKLDTISKYRRELVAKGIANNENSSILIVLGHGHKDTSNLEAQIRGSRYAWDTRVISCDALVRLMSLKEEIENPQIIKQISQVLIPHEFTKLDSIIELVFAETEDIKQEVTEITSEKSDDRSNEKSKPVSFHEACIKRIEKKLKVPFIKQTRTSYASPDNSMRLTCAVSKPYDHNDYIEYWFAFHPHQRKYLEESTKGYVAFGCGDEKNLILIPIEVFVNWIILLNTTDADNRMYSHVKIRSEQSGYYLYNKGPNIDLNPFLI